MYANIPAELQTLPNWVVWQYEVLENGKTTKIPYSPRTGHKASVTRPETWVAFAEAINAAHLYDGIGLVLTKDLGITIIDLDNKPDNPCTPEQLARHTAIYNAIDSYTEMSVSGTGVHIVLRGSLPAGVHRDNVEMYSSERYMAFTGKVLRSSPIRDHQELLDAMYGQMKPAATIELTDRESTLSDTELVEMASRAVNGEKFNALCAGDQTGYESQSEADFALLAILAFYSPDNEQVRRVFRMTALGKRAKAIKNNTYLDFALGKIRAKQPLPVDMDQMAANANALLALKPSSPPEPPPPPPPPTKGNLSALRPQSAHVPEPLQNEHAEPMPSDRAVPHISLPPGLVGELATYFYQTAIRPVPEIALAAAIGIMAGVCGRAYNVSDSGLNQYLILLARTGSGKEGAASGIEKLIAAVRPQIPMVTSYQGPAQFASGQALIKVLGEKPCFVSVLGEFGITLQQICDPRANSAEKMFKKVLLDLYVKSGWARTLQSSAYSDTEKSTKAVQAPSVTILGESTPETFFDGLDAGHIVEGLIPRFLVIEYKGKRPPRNKNAGSPPSTALAQRFIDQVAISLTTSNNNTYIPVKLDGASLDLMDDFDTRADHKMNQAGSEVVIQIWNRAHLKAIKLAALIAVGVNPHTPIVTADIAQWAIDFVLRDVEGVTARFAKGDIGQGDSKQFNDIQAVVKTYFTSPSKSTKDRYSTLIRARIIPYAYLLSRLVGYSSFRTDKSGATFATKKNVQAMIDSGMLVEIPKAVVNEKCGFSGTAYGVGSNWVD